MEDANGRLNEEGGKIAMILDMEDHRSLMANFTESWVATQRDVFYTPIEADESALGPIYDTDGRCQELPNHQQVNITS